MAVRAEGGGHAIGKTSAHAAGSNNPNRYFFSATGSKMIVTAVSIGGMRSVKAS
jgi:hypothetical protein